MLVKDFCNELYNHIFSALDGECVNSSPCGVGGERAAEIATKVSELVRDMLDDVPKITNKQFKLAMRQDGNFKNSNSRLTYVLRAIRSEQESRRITPKQFKSLTNWAGENFSDLMPSTHRKP